LQASIYFLEAVSQHLGNKINVNFDAEGPSNALREEEYPIIYKAGYLWSETFQASASWTQPVYKLARKISTLLERYGDRLSVNVVIGNRAYGIENPSFRKMDSVIRELCLQMPSSNIKIGAEGMKNGMKAIDLAAEFDLVAYLLQTPYLYSLLEYCKERGVRAVVYTPCRVCSIDNSKEAIREVLRIIGTGYFERRGLKLSEVDKDEQEQEEEEEKTLDQINSFGIFGSLYDALKRISDLTSKGVWKVVLSPMFENMGDLKRQLELLSGKYSCKDG
jgi:hypothetical protein